MEGNSSDFVLELIFITIFLLQKSSVPSIAPPCECLNVGFQNCILYPAGFCECSGSCNFVKSYLQDGEHNDPVDMVSMRSITPGILTPVNGVGGQFSPSDLQNTLEVLCIGDYHQLLL